jgi:hypothetical protein
MDIHVHVTVSKVQEKKLNLQEKSSKSHLKVIADFSTENVQARREWNDVFYILKENKLLTKIIMPSKVILQK